MEHGIIVTLGPDGLASSVAVPASGMVCDIYANISTHITASVVTPDAWCELELSKLPCEEGLYWVQVMPYGLECAFSFEDFGFPGGLFEQLIPKANVQTMVAEAIVLLTSVMGYTREQMSNLFDVVTE